MNFSIVNLQGYPNNGEHLKLIGHSLPCNITKGLDFYTNKKLWYVDFFDSFSIVLNHGFKTEMDAYCEAKKKYIAWLRSELENMQIL